MISRYDFNSGLRNQISTHDGENLSDKSRGISASPVISIRQNDNRFRLMCRLDRSFILFREIDSVIISHITSFIAVYTDTK